jgi:hypothetical protein
MRSYYEHLETAMGYPKTPIPPKPTLRSSAIFPVMNLFGIHSRILFMGYWILKRNIKEIATVVTLRSLSGQILGRQSFTITEAKTYRIELTDQLAAAGLPTNQPFTGSLEIEFFSTVNLVFPFPAVVINYYGPKFSTVVHSAQRVYNDFEDLQRNSQTQVPESGFNVYADEEKEPFIGLINGGQAVPNSRMELEFYNIDGEKMTHELQIGDLAPYETRMIYPARELDLQKFLKGKVGAGKAKFNVNWIFPRLVVGNIHHQIPALTITHTYYDTTQAKGESDYWRPSEPAWYPATLMVPAAVKGKRFTNVYFYPIYSPASFIIDVEIYNFQGKLLGRKQDVLQMQAPYTQLKRIEIKEICKELHIPTEEDLGARIIARTPHSSRLPARIKLGLDLGESPEKMPCNICTNLQPFNPPLETKPKTFRWAPVLADQINSNIWIMNSAPNIDYQRQADVELTFFHEKDNATLIRKITLPPHGFAVIRPNEDPELKAFFEGVIGWFTAVATNPYTSTYYFAENASGYIGGDHGF